MNSYVYTKEKLFSEIEKNKPDVVVMDLDLYAKIDGIEISRRIRNRFDVPVVYV
jgi:DNA-binding response OmpR family regulator